ncbi:superoxide dismutase [Bacillus sp. FJAT-27445]|uniref:superoxide dismutase n=1 Tax=Bacillus sp. FJAT-27445 TaxID=1679166 RepID=UPI000A4A8DB6|nr:superoxide dismutase [Bacillus sp. FJAT-27445]
MKGSKASEKFLPGLIEWAELLENEAGRTPSISPGDNPRYNFREEVCLFLSQLNSMRGNEIDLYEAIKLEKTAWELYLKWQQLNDGMQYRPATPDVSVQAGKHTLPRLPYGYEALEPYISRRIMMLHHSQHHQSYVDGLNKAEKEMEQARQENRYDFLKHWEREAAFHGAGHYLHTLFWEVMGPNGGGRPERNLLASIEKAFGSFDKFKTHFSEAAKRVEGSGWAILVWAPRPRRLEILQAEKHQNLSQWDVIPLLPLDVWEHAYYLQYESNRGKYVENWWNVVNWPEVEKRYNEARKIKWEPY